MPESDDAPITFVCEQSAGEMILDLSLGEDFRPQSGEAAVTITAPPTKDSMALTGQLQVSEDVGDTILEAHGRFGPPLSHMLSKGKELIVTIGKEKRIFPLTGAAEAMRPLASACGEPK